MDEVSTSDLDSRISKLTALVDSYIVGRAQHFQPPRHDPYHNTYNPHWGDHPNYGYARDQQVHAFEGFYEQPRHDPYYNTYSPGWRDYPDFSYAEANNYQDYQGYQAQPEPQSSNFDEIMKTLQSIQQDQLNKSLNATMLRREEELQDVWDDDESWQVQEQVAKETQPENCLSQQTGQTETVESLDIIDCMSQENFYVDQNDMLNNDFCREENQKEPELKETDCCIQQVDCSQAQTEERSVAPLQENSQMNLAQSETLPVAPLQLPSHETPFILPLQINLAQGKLGVKRQSGENALKTAKKCQIWKVPNKKSFHIWKVPNKESVHIWKVPNKERVRKHSQQTVRNSNCRIFPALIRTWARKGRFSNKASFQKRKVFK